MTWHDTQREIAHQDRVLGRLGIKRYVSYRKFKCGHKANHGNVKAGVCMECILKQQPRRYSPADSQAEMSFNTEPVFVGAN